MNAKQLRYLIYTDFFRIMGRDLTKKEYLTALMGKELKSLGYASRGFKFVFDFRNYKYNLYKKHNRIHRWYWKNRYNRTCIKYGLEFSVYTKVGKGFVCWHTNGIVVDAEAVLGDNCSIIQQVTIGHKLADASDKVANIGNGVVIGAGAKLIGEIAIGNNVRIGSNAVVTHSFPDNCSIAGVPARVLNNNIDNAVKNVDYLPYETYIHLKINRKSKKGGAGRRD